MLTARDYLHLPPWEAVVALTNHKYNLQLTPHTVTLEAFQPEGATRTALRLRRNRSSWWGNLLKLGKHWDVVYDRLPLETLTSAGPVVVSVGRFPLSAQSLVSRLKTATGITFVLEDFEEVGEITQAGELTLTAHPRSLRWVGSLQVLISTLKKPLMDVITQPHIQGLHYLTDHPTKAVGSWRTFPYDFTPFRSALRSLVDDQPRLPARWLAVILNDVTGRDWGVEREYRPLYNGPVTPVWTSRTDCRFVLVVSLTPQDGDDFEGPLLLHYN